jgi:hypothetical protein
VDEGVGSSLAKFYWNQENQLRFFVVIAEKIDVVSVSGPAESLIVTLQQPNSQVT